MVRIAGISYYQKVARETAMVGFPGPRFIWRIALAVLLVATGCSSAEKDQATTTTVVSETSPSAAPAPSPVGGKAVSRLPTAGEPLDPNGYYFGFIRSIDPSAAPSKVGFDVAEFLTGEEALAAAVEAGDASQEEGLPNDFYIRNRSAAVREVQVAPDVSITLIRCPGSCESAPAGWPDLVRLLREPQPEGGEGFYGGPESPFWITLKDGKAAAIEEQYLP